MNINEFCKIRNIRKFDVETPILIPSFSSIINEKIAGIYIDLDEYINEYSLVSAYDINYNGISESHFNCSNIIFIDSGYYEIDNIKNPEEWSIDMYKSILSKLPKITNYVIVNYDLKKPIKTQIKEAKALFSKYSDYASCFLCKPEDESTYTTNIAEYIKNLNETYNFDILGFTEKELGRSFEERCKNIIKIREELNKKGYNHPIHIFGCLDPISIIVYFLCGADIFDGLNWLKYGFFEKNAVYQNNYAILSGDWAYQDNSVWKTMSIKNLSELRHITSSMKHFVRVKNLGVFELPEKTLNQVKALTGAAGIDFG
jgi:hypothetical protein